ncbi:MAG: hypothetical protein ACOC4G_11965 [Bacillota bacterium]
MHNKIKELWNVELEKKFLNYTNATKFAVISCTECNYSYQAFFRKKKPRYCPKCNGKLRSNTPQGRNAPVANYTEQYAVDLINTVLSKRGYENLEAKRDVICEDLGLTSRSEADIAIVESGYPNKRREYSAERIVIVFEVKMSIVFNWVPGPKLDSDYDGHKGRGSIYRTDSILKAIGKGTILRSHYESHDIPYIVLGNCPPPSSYMKKINGSKSIGIVQGFVSLNPNPLIVDKSNPKERDPKSSKNNGFIRMDSIQEFGDYIVDHLETERVFIGSMISKKKLGKLIKSISLNNSYKEIGKEFFDKLHKKIKVK